MSLAALPSTFSKLSVEKFSTSFGEATKIVSVPFPKPLPKAHVVVKVKYAGVNASDINYTAGKYRTDVKPPFDVGFEGLGTIVALSPDLDKDSFPIGQPVAITGWGCYSEYCIVPAKTVIPIPHLSPSILPILVSGLTASIALEQVGQMTSNQTVLVTAAAGGTGQFAVQLARQAGNHVIGTCSTDTKVEFLKNLGCHRVINYKKENLAQVLSKEYPKGIDIVYESVGGVVFDTCVQNLAPLGKVIIIGLISGYETGAIWGSGTSSPSNNKTSPQGSFEVGTLSAHLLTRSASIRGFFLFHFRSHWKNHLLQLFSLVENGTIKSVVDEKPFKGLQSVEKAVSYLYSGQNLGKVVVTISDDAKL